MTRLRAALTAASVVLTSAAPRALAAGSGANASGSGSTSAETKHACSSAAVQAQRLRNDGKLKDAREQLVICARNVCPAVVRKDCEPWLSDIENRLPTVVVVAKDGKGGDVVDVKVSVDGQQVTDRLDGKAIPVDPGVHAFRYEHAGSPPVDDKLVIREGERDRVVEVKFDGGANAAGGDANGAGAGAQGQGSTALRTEKGGAPAGAFLFGALGLVGVGSFVYFDLSAKSDIDDMRGTCAPRCDQSRVDSVNTKIIVADVSLGVGVVALGIATYLFFARPTKVVEVRSATAGFTRTRSGGLGTVGFTF